MTVYRSAQPYVPCGVGFYLRPNLTPRFLVRRLPSSVRSLIMLRSSSESPSKTVNKNLSMELVVLAHGLRNERNEAFAVPIFSLMTKRS